MQYVIYACDTNTPAKLVHAKPNTYVVNIIHCIKNWNWSETFLSSLEYKYKARTYVYLLHAVLAAQYRIYEYINIMCAYLTYVTILLLEEKT